MTKIGRFRTVTPLWIHWWLWNDAQSWKQYRRVALLFSKVIRQISRSYGTKIADFAPNWALFQSHTGWKNDDLNMIWVGLLGRSQLSNSSDLTCFGLYAYFSNEPFQCILWLTGTLYFLRWLAPREVTRSLCATILICPISLDFFWPDNVYSSCPFVFLTATSSSINTVCLSVRHTSLALSRL